MGDRTASATVIEAEIEHLVATLLPTLAGGSEAEGLISSSQGVLDSLMDYAYSRPLGFEMLLGPSARPLNAHFRSAAVEGVRMAIETRLCRHLSHRDEFPDAHRVAADALMIVGVSAAELALRGHLGAEHAREFARRTGDQLIEDIVAGERLTACE